MVDCKALLKESADHWKSQFMVTSKHEDTAVNTNAFAVETEGGSIRDALSASEGVQCSECRKASIQYWKLCVWRRRRLSNSMQD